MSDPNNTAKRQLTEEEIKRVNSLLEVLDKLDLELAQSSITADDMSKLDPSLIHFQKADELVKCPIPDPLADVTEDEPGTIAQIAILEKAFTIVIPVNDKGEFDPAGTKKRTYGGLPGTMAGIDKFVNLTPAIEGKRADLYAQTLKPAQPTAIIPDYLHEDKESFFDKVKGFFAGFGGSKRGSD